MSIARLFLLGLLMLVCACTPFRRGFEGEKLVSPARPAVSMDVSILPLLAYGQTSPLKYTDFGFQMPETLVAVYGTDAVSPMAIVILAEVPSDGWVWDPLTFSTQDSPVTSMAVLGGQGFSGSTHIINGKNDPFAPLVLPDEQSRAQTNWLAQRYALLCDFEKIKLILEYREPLPASLEGKTQLPLGSSELISAFQARAERAFQVRFEFTGTQPVPQPPYLNTLNGTTLGAYLGTMSWRDLLFPQGDD